jgi:hypothetical protein
VASDNYNDSQTQAALDEFKENPRLHCLRTDRLLNMPEHWDFATQHARGRYVLILTDRSVLKQGALRTIHEAISSTDKPVELCSWRWSIFNDIAGCEVSDQPVSKEGNVHLKSSVEYLKDFASGIGIYNNGLPRGLNSCYKLSFLQRIRDEFGSPFRPISPDYFLAFATLGMTRDILFIDKALFISQGLDTSNGTNNFKKTCVNYLKSMGNADFYAHVPIKSPTCHNLIYEDFLTARELIGGNLKEIECDWPGYFSYCYAELLSKKSWGLMEPDELQSLFDEWERALSTFDEATQTATREKIEKLSQTTPSQKQIKSKQENHLSFLSIYRLKGFISKLVNPFRKEVKEKIVSQEKKRGLSALELAGF